MAGTTGITVILAVIALLIFTIYHLICKTYRSKKFIFLIMAVFIIMVIITGCTDSDPGNSPADKTTVEQDDSLPEQQEEHQPETSLSTESSSSDKQEAAEEKPDDSGTLKVHFVDVGQADSILIQLSSCQNILIDGGNNDDGTLVVNYLK